MYLEYDVKQDGLYLRGHEEGREGDGEPRMEPAEQEGRVQPCHQGERQLKHIS